MPLQPPLRQNVKNLANLTNGATADFASGAAALVNYGFAAQASAAPHLVYETVGGRLELLRTQR